MKNEFRIILMFIIMLLISIFLMHFVAITWTCVNTAGLRWSWPLRILPAALTVIFVGGMYFTRIYHDGPAGLPTKILYIWLGFLFLWFALAMAAMGVQLLLGIFKAQISYKLGPAVFACAVIVSVLSVYTAARTPAVKVIEISSPKISKTVTIAQISDTHLGDGVSTKQLQNLFDALAPHKPDIIVFTGDIFERPRSDNSAYIKIINEAPAPGGKYGSLGNHEYYGGAQDNINIWRQAGIIPLLNASTEAAGINIVGVNDIRTAHVSREEFTEIIEKSDTSKYTLVLSHPPVYYKEAAEAGADLLLSGHTHRGQIWPFNLLARTQFRRVYGMYEDGASRHYVTAGAFYWGPPMRFMTNNEVPVFIIKPNP